jgi:hypothetical protein
LATRIGRRFWPSLIVSQELNIGESKVLSVGSWDARRSSLFIPIKKREELCYREQKEVQETSA